MWWWWKFSITTAIRAFTPTPARRKNETLPFADGHATVASTCTLVTERLMQLQSDDESFPAPLAILLLGVILLDSVNLVPEAGKATPRDAAAVRALLDRTRWEELLCTTIVTVMPLR